jgi:membrane protease YdiL (CAAX protease family)
MSAQPPAIPETTEPVWSLWLAFSFAILWAVLNEVILNASLILAASLSMPAAAELSQEAVKAGFERFIKDISSSSWAPFGQTGCFLLAWLMTFGLIEMLFRRFPRPALGRALGLKVPTPRWSLSVAIPLGIAVCLVAASLDNWLLPSDSAQDPAEAILATVPGLSGTALRMLLVAPIAEEIFFRGFLLPPMLRRFSPSVSILLNATIFMVAHLTITGFDIAALYSVLLLGLVVASLRVWSGSVFPGILAYLFFNGTSLGLFWLTR